MTDDTAIKVENLSKCYQIYDQPRHRLMQMLWRGHKQFYREFWALKDVSFEVGKGETVGIIGRNGSGKSTLLQMICGTLNPTSGTITTNGRIAALLELGSGFNPEFTGIENIYMNGSVLGLNIHEIEERFDDIVSFAGIGDFISQPVKTYSSGMAVRLAFSVAINVGPNILIVDEALSVGDEVFQRKCFSRIEALRSSGTTILFVSHSGGTIVELCDRAILLDAGDRLAIGAPKKIVGQYQKLIYAPHDKQASIRKEICEDNKNTIGKPLQKLKAHLELDEELSLDHYELTDSYDPALRPASTISYESYGAIIQDPAVYSLNGDRLNNLSRGRSYRYRYRVSFSRDASLVRFGMLIKTTTGVELGGAASAMSSRASVPYVKAGTVYLVEFEFFCRLNPGVYFLNAGVVGDINGSETYLHRLVDVAIFRVISETDSLATGVIDFSCNPIITPEV